METQDIKNEAVAENTNKAADNNQNGTHFDHVKETLEILYKTFPNAFIKEGDAKPLKIGIFEDLKTKIADIEELSISKVRAALRLYTSRLKYLYSVKNGANRIDLDGNDCGDVVNAEHETYAKEKIAEINAKRKPQKPKKNVVTRKNTNAKKAPNKFVKKPFKIDGEKATVDNISVGTDVLVLSGEQHYVRGVVSEFNQKDTVVVTLKSGMSLSLPLSRVLLPKKGK